MLKTVRMGSLERRDRLTLAEFDQELDWDLDLDLDCCWQLWCLF